MPWLVLGPIVGHTDHESTRIWIRASDDPANYTLRIRKHGKFPFVSTEPGEPEFGTAVAQATGLHADREYRFDVIRRHHVIARGHGTFRTFPLPRSGADILFATVSCSHNTHAGAWKVLRDYIEKAKPRFLLMIGDQVYQDDAGVWNAHLDGAIASREKRRKALADTYQQVWSREDIAPILANIPTYMMWDDHEVRDGWGSWASDSPTLATRYPSGAPIAARYGEYFEDARDVFWHFQMSHNSIAPDATPPPYGTRIGMPFAFRCGRLAVLVVDDRGARDLWRTPNPVLGDEQWLQINGFIDGLPQDVDCLAVVTPLPLASMSPTGLGQRMLGGREDDVKLFKQGKMKQLRELQSHKDSGGDKALVIGGAAVGFFLGSPSTGAVSGGNLGDFKVADIDDARDQWSHRFCRPEQEALIRRARTHGKSATQFGAKRLFYRRGPAFWGVVRDLGCQTDIHCRLSHHVGHREAERFAGGSRPGGRRGLRDRQRYSRATAGLHGGLQLRRQFHHVRRRGASRDQRCRSRGQPELSDTAHLVRGARGACRRHSRAFLDGQCSREPEIRTPTLGKENWEWLSRWPRRGMNVFNGVPSTQGM